MQTVEKGCLLQTVRGPGLIEAVCKLGLVVAVAFLNVTSPNGSPDHESASCKEGL